MRKEASIDIYLTNLHSTMLYTNPTQYTSAPYMLVYVHLLVSRKEKRWREAERQRLMADRDSVGTAGSVSRASAVGDRRRWRKYGESSTLMVRLTITFTIKTSSQ